MTARNELIVERRGPEPESRFGHASGEPEPISAVGLRKVYRGRTALDRVDLHVGRGQVVGLLGPNGAGKTTTVKSLLGMVHLDGGTATVLGRPAGDPAARRLLGYLPEQFQYPAWLDGRQVLEVHGRLLGLPAEERPGAVDDALRLVGLAGRGDDLDLRVHGGVVLGQDGWCADEDVELYMVHQESVGCARCSVI